MWFSKDVNIVKKARKFSIQVNEQYMVVHDHCVIHTICILMFVEPQPLGVIVIGFANFDGGAIDGSIGTWECVYQG